MLKAFEKRQGSLEVPHDSRQYQDLHDWIWEQRRSYKHEVLSTQQQRQLESIGFEWDPQRVLTNGKERKNKNGNHSKRKRKRRNGKKEDASAVDSESDAMSIEEGGTNSSDDDNELLQKLKPAANMKERLENEKWVDAYQTLKAFRKKHGPTKPISVRQHNFLYRWCIRQRSKYRDNKLPSDRKKLLDAIPSWQWVPGTNQVGDDEDRASESEEEMDVPRSKTKGRRKSSKPAVADSEEEAEADDKEEEESNEEEDSDNDGDAGKRRGNNQEYFERQWMEKYKELKSYKRKHGDIAVPSTGKTLQLHTWIIYQRRLFRKGKIHNERKKLLDKLGFVWDPTGRAQERVYSAESSSSDDDDEEAQDQPTDRYERKWLEKYQSLKAYKRKHGHMDIPSTGNEIVLYQWTLWQRRQLRQKKISKERKRLLDKLRFYWGSGATAEEGGDVDDDDDDDRNSNEEEDKLPDDKYAAQWMEKYEALKAYKRKHGNLNVPSTAKETLSLYQWTSWQRRQLKVNKLTKERKQLLDKLGFSWVPGTEVQGESADESSSGEDEGDEEEEQATHSKKFRHNSYYQAQWMEKYEKLKAHKKKFGHLVVSASKKANNEALYFWVIRQRKMKERNKLPEDRENLLNKIGFFDDDEQVQDLDTSTGGSSSADESSGEDDKAEDKGGQAALSTQPRQNSYYQAQWMEKYEKLKAHKKKFGHLVVSASKRANNETLYFWIIRQRKQKEQNKLPEDREKLLNKIGFFDDKEGDKEQAHDLDTSTDGGGSECSSGVSISDSSGEEMDESQSEDEGTWTKRYHRLRRYSKNYGCVTVPHRYGDGFESLALWSRKQRRSLEEKRLSGSRKRKLDKLGFYWGRHASTEDSVISDSDASDDSDATNTNEGGSDTRKTGVGDEDMKYSRIQQQLPIRVAKAPSQAQQQKWLQGYENLKEYKAKFGNLDIRNRDHEYRSLYTWVTRQRRMHWEQSLTTERKELLDAIGFPWQHQQPSEPQKSGEAQSFGSQAAQGVESEGPSERKRDLASLPIFTSNQSHDQGWVEHFRRLQKLKKKFGTMEIQYKDAKRKALYNWIWRQRRLKREKKLPSDRLQLLDSIGFDWIDNRDAGDSESDSESQSGESQQDGVREKQEDFEDESASQGSSTSFKSEASVARNEVMYEFNGANADDQTNGAVSSAAPVDPDKIEDLKAYLGEVELQIQGKKKEIKHLHRKRARLERS